MKLNLKEWRGCRVEEWSNGENIGWENEVIERMLVG